VAVLFLTVGCRGSAVRSGVSAQLLAGAAILGSLRKLNLYNIVFGISFERALFWHKLMAALFFACLVIHAYIMISTNTLSNSGKYSIYHIISYMVFLLYIFIHTDSFTHMHA